MKNTATIETAPTAAPQTLTVYASDALAPAARAYAEAQGVTLTMTADAAAADLLLTDHAPGGSLLDVRSDTLLAAAAAGAELDTTALYTMLYRKALEGEPDCGGLIACNYYSGEPVTGLSGGRPLLVRRPDSRLTLANLMRAHLYAAMATLKLGHGTFSPARSRWPWIGSPATAASSRWRAWPSV